MADADGLAPGTGINWQSETVGVVEYAADKNQQAIFYMEPQLDPQKSAEMGRPIKKDTIMVRIAPPGERLNIVVRPAQQSDTRRWPMQWNQFQQHKKQTGDGTPIEMLFPATPSIAANLKASGVYTVEQCATLSGHAIDSIGMGAQKWVNAAVKYLEVASRGVKASQMQKELDQRDGEIRVLNQKVVDLTTTVQRLMANINNAASMHDQTLIAHGMVRPQHMPQRPFDPQLAQINATSPTRQIQQQRRRRPRPTL
jgi:hypothetical protein